MIKDVEILQKLKEQESTLIEQMDDHLEQRNQKLYVETMSTLRNLKSLIDTYAKGLTTKDLYE